MIYHQNKKKKTGKIINMISFIKIRNGLDTSYHNWSISLFKQ